MTRDGYPNCNFDQHRSCCTLAPKQHYIHMTYTHIMYMHLEPKVFLVLIEKVWKVLFWVGSTPQNKTRPWIALKYFFNVYNTAVWYIYIPGTHLSFVLPPKKGLFQSKQGTFGFEVYIYIYKYSMGSTMFHLYTLPHIRSGLIFRFCFFFPPWKFLRPVLFHAIFGAGREPIHGIPTKRKALYRPPWNYTNLIGLFEIIQKKKSRIELKYLTGK